MTDESTRVVFHLDPDEALVGVLRTAVLFQGLQAGMGSELCADFAKASEDVCRETFSQLTEAGRGLEVTLDTFQDRIEVCIYHHGQTTPAVGLESFAFSEPSAGVPGRLNGLELLSRVDRVLFNCDGGVARTTLVKFLQAQR